MTLLTTALKETDAYVITNGGRGHAWERVAAAVYHYMYCYVGPTSIIMLVVKALKQHVFIEEKADALLRGYS